MGKSSLAPGFRFKPTDVELVQYYLKRRLLGKRLGFKVIAEVDIYKYDPWDLPDKSCWDCGDLKWYFFCPREKKYRSGNRVQRATEGGYWKTTGKDRSVLYSGAIVGWIKTLIFHTGRAPSGDRTNWVMHEYRLEDQGLADRGVPLDSYVLCMIFQKEGLGPRIGAQYGAPFKEEDWSDDEVEITSEAVQVAITPEPDLGLPCNYVSPTATNAHSVGDIGVGPSGSGIYDILPPFCEVSQPVSSNYVILEMPLASVGDDIISMFDCFTEESALYTDEPKKVEAEGRLETVQNANMPSTHSPEVIGVGPSFESCGFDVLPPCNVNESVSCNFVTMENPPASNGVETLPIMDCFAEESMLFVNDNGKNEELNNLEHLGNATPHFNTSNIYEDLGDLENLGRVGEVGYNFCSEPDSRSHFLELYDLDQPQHPNLFF
ncbi:PREDICTED: NAC domain-containing protein 82-like [Prunus mume]|uniref:NAC domain-containing protein 82-like n=1 Tax=Prunus mume TaxID=102107 RepID=A0ABM0PCA3_PRUMU|nr:PREDICTED: NAC domain-containing protein 82-like [Prunus mume]